MANWCLSSRNYETLKKIIKEHSSYLFWSDDIRPLLKELEPQLKGSIIPNNRINDAPISVKLDHEEEVCIYNRDELIQCTVVKTVLEKAGVNLETSLTRRRERFLSFKWCNH